MNGVKLIMVVDECSCANFSNGILLLVVNKLFMFTFLSYHSCVVMTASTPPPKVFFKPVNLLRHCQHATGIPSDKCTELSWFDILDVRNTITVYLKIAVSYWTLHDKKQT